MSFEQCSDVRSFDRMKIRILNSWYEILVKIVDQEVLPFVYSPPSGGDVMPDNSGLKIKIIIGSTRRDRFGDKPANWIFEETNKESSVFAEILDLRDYPMPFLEEAIQPARLNRNYSNETVKKWAEKINDGDAFIMVTPEYNHGYPAV